MELSSLNNVRWWHRNIARKGFSINGAINAYPDLMAKTESGKLLLIETKGDQLENSESKEKQKLGQNGLKWLEECISTIWYLKQKIRDIMVHTHMKSL